MAEDAMLLAARARRDQMMARMTFWERWKTLVVPLAMALSLVLGWLLGKGIRVVLPVFPEQGVWFVSVLALALIGRLLSSFFNPSKLAAAQQLTNTLEARNKTKRP